ncbi:hypothetical protein OQA88_3612 [Cercophora sp. LCS_1]
MSGSVDLGVASQEKETETPVQSVGDATVPPPDVVLPSAVPEEEQADETLEDNVGAYWDADSMASLNAASAAAIARLRAYKPPPAPIWDRLHLTRRAAVLLLLFADRRGDLRVVITMRAASLRSFSGHAAFPGGKADSVSETPYQIARREAWEEIGLPMDDAKLPSPFRIEHLCYLPMNLARTELIVRPCVAFLHTDGKGRGEGGLIPKLDAKEVAAVFSASFHNFLRADDEGIARKPPGKWYEGNWLQWHDEPWRVHYFGVPVTDQKVVTPGGGDGDALAEERFKVWGMTARILVDAAMIAYGETPEFEHLGHYGDEGLIRQLDEWGQLGPKVRSAAQEDAKVVNDGRGSDGKKNGEGESKI